MNNMIVEKLKALNDDYMPRYLGTSHELEEVVPLSDERLILDKNNKTRYGLDYYDLMMVNILMKRHRDIKCELTANMAELITRMGYEGLRHLKIFMREESAREFCNDIALHRMPNRMHLYCYLDWILRYEQNALPYWFYYTLLMFAFVDTKRYKHHPYRSRILVGCIHAYGLVKFTDYNADHTHDVFNVREKLNRIILSCTRDERYKKDYKAYAEYMVDSLREFSICTFASLLSRSCTWPLFQEVGNEVLTQRLIEHQNVVDNHYKHHVNKEN